MEKIESFVNKHEGLFPPYPQKGLTFKEYVKNVIDNYRQPNTPKDHKDILEQFLSSIGMIPTFLL